MNIKQETIQMHIQFLNTAKFYIEQDKSLSQYVDKTKVSNNIVKVMLDLGYIERIERGKYRFLLSSIDEDKAIKLIEAVYIYQRPKPITKDEEQKLDKTVEILGTIKSEQEAIISESEEKKVAEVIDKIIEIPKSPPISDEEAMMMATKIGEAITEEEKNHPLNKFTNGELIDELRNRSYKGTINKKLTIEL